MCESTQQTTRGVLHLICHTISLVVNSYFALLELSHDSSSGPVSSDLSTNTAISLWWLLNNRPAGDIDDVFQDRMHSCLKTGIKNFLGSYFKEAWPPIHSCPPGQLIFPDHHDEQHRIRCVHLQILLLMP